ncbi:hypothetical protein APICC_08710 [Apis cerana cerana]|uniref:Uncharacterized protein n=1 Tax=Apis cerana cerana TaxID=94128 RepID=A0A2A3E3N3_APICC|nr:hypothetical protein APICC_08710 [Apis cerana cerana]
MHPQCAIVWAEAIIGLFFKNAAVFVPKLQNMNVNNMWFQQDGAICHTTRETIQLLHESFPDHGFLKSKVYVQDKSTITHALKEEIECCINEIQPHLCKTISWKISTKKGDKFNGCTRFKLLKPIIHIAALH